MTLEKKEAFIPNKEIADEFENTMSVEGCKIIRERYCWQESIMIRDNRNKTHSCVIERLTKV